MTTVSTCNKYTLQVLNKICRFFTSLVLNDVRNSSEGSDSEDDTYARPDMNPEPVYTSIRDHTAQPDSSSGRQPLCAGAPRILLGSLYHIRKACAYNPASYAFKRIITFSCTCCRDDLCISNLYGLYHLYIY